MIKPEIENTFDQFNPFHMRSTAGSDTSRQPPFFQGIGFVKKMAMIQEALGFVISEFGPFKGLLPQVLKNILSRAILRKYKVSIVE